MSNYNELAKHFIQAMLNGHTTNGTEAQALGPWAEQGIAIKEAYERTGKSGARSAFIALSQANPALAELIAGDVSSRPLETISADEILDTSWPDPVWAIPGILPAGLTILAGRPKLGKSWLVLQVAKAVASRGVIFDKLIDQAGPVLYFALEDNPRRLQDRMKMQGWPRGLPVEFVTMEQFKDKVGNFLTGGAECLAKQIESKNYHLTIIDTLSRACFEDQNRNERMSEILAPIQEIALKRNLAIMLVDHHSSHLNNGDNTDPIGHIMGGTSKGATLDTAWGLYRERGKIEAKLHIVTRDADEQTISLTFNKSNGLWEFQGDYYSLKMTEKRRQYLSIIRDLGGKAKNADVAKNLGVAAPTSHEVLSDLVVQGHAKKDTIGSSVYYALTEQGEKLLRDSGI